MAAILSPLSIYGDNQKTKIPLKSKLGYTPTKGTLGICLCSTIRRMPDDRPSRSLDASLAIPMRVFRFEASGCEPLPYTGSGRGLRLAFLATMQPALDPTGHQVPRVRPTCLSTPRRPRKA
jgi:hypothetical protein